MNGKKAVLVLSIFFIAVGLGLAIYDFLIDWHEDPLHELWVIFRFVYIIRSGFFIGFGEMLYTFGFRYHHKPALILFIIQLISGTAIFIYFLCIESDYPKALLGIILIIFSAVFLSRRSK